MLIDKIDRKIIHHLDFNARIPLSVLAKKVGLSKQVAKYRLDNLQKRGVIQGFYADINASKLGFTIYLVYLKFHRFPSEAEKRFIEHVSKQDSAGVSATLNGAWDFCLGIWARSVVQFKRSYQKIMTDYEQYVKSKTVMIETDFYYFKPRAVTGINSDEQITMMGDLEDFYLDDIDQKVLSQLSLNCRISLLDLSKIIHLTPNALKARINRLRKAKVILGYRLMLNYPLLGFLHYRTFLHLENLTLDKERSVLQFLKQQPSVVSVTKTIGFCEMEFRCVVRDVHEYYVLMDELKKHFPQQFQSYDSILYYKFHTALNYFPFAEVCAF